MKNKFNPESIKPGLYITEDEYGVPSIVGQTDYDVFYATGYMHAKDRLWQLELMQRTASGRLSELFGKEAIPSDVQMRSLDLYSAAKSAYGSLNPEVQKSLQSYADGINSWIAEDRRLPVAFKLFQISPHKWTPIDSLAWMKVFSLSLSHNFHDELVHAYANDSMSPAQFRAIFGFSPHGEPGATESKSASLQGLLPNLSHAENFVNNTTFAKFRKFAGSNALAISGRFTKDGSSILANDPHLALQIPSIWYVLRQRGDKLRSSGMNLVGIPLVVFGQNGIIAWGGTSMTGDTQDLVMETIKPDNPKLYKNGETWEPFRTRIERVEVRAMFPSILREKPDPITLTLRSSINGPIITDVGVNGTAVFSLRWTGLLEKDTTYQSLYEVNYSKNWEEFRNALSKFIAPTMNFLFSDNRGNIGFQGAGKIPIRSGYLGNYPILGSYRALKWIGYIPYAEMPNEYNPARGYIVSANNRNIDANYPYLISNSFASEARAQRMSTMIDQILLSEGAVSKEQIKKIQNDVVSLPAKRILPLLLQIKPKSKIQQEAMDLLKKWDGQMSKESIAASIFNVWMRHFTETALTRSIPFHWNNRYQNEKIKNEISHLSLDRIYEILSDPHNPFCPAKDEQENIACGSLLLSSFDSALIELTKLRGSQKSEWNWGNIHQARFENFPLSSMAGVTHIFTRSISTGGTPDTISVANYEFNQSIGYVQTFGSTFRQIISLKKNHIEHVYTTSTGQSESPFSEHYDDMLMTFSKNKYLMLENISPNVSESKR